jgi:hypothetical protein
MKKKQTYITVTPSTEIRRMASTRDLEPLMCVIRMKMGAAMDADVDGSKLFYQNKCASSDFECSNCIALEKHLHSALVELASANLITKQQKEVNINLLKPSGNFTYDQV